MAIIMLINTETVIMGMYVGTSIVLEVRAQEAVATFRETAGPWDIDMAKVRAIYRDRLNTIQLL